MSCMYAPAVFVAVGANGCKGTEVKRFSSLRLSSTDRFSLAVSHTTCTHTNTSLITAQSIDQQDNFDLLYVITLHDVKDLHAASTTSLFSAE